MRKKPKGKKYRNLVARGEVIYAQVQQDGKRTRVSLHTDDWTEAARLRDLYEAELGRPGFLPAKDASTLAEVAELYLEKGIAGLSASTQKSRRSYLAEKGRLLSALGHLPLERVTVERLRGWWDDHVGTGEIGLRTGVDYINVLSALFKYARRRGMTEADNPCTRFREELGELRATKAGRVATGSKARPIEDAGDLAKLIAAARAEGLTEYAYVLAHLDAGLRNGEVLGLRWGDIAERELLIRQNRPRGGMAEAPKSGRSRTVALSRRLAAVLEELERARFRPGPERLVFEGIYPQNFHRGPWRRILKRAGIGHRAIKDLRDTYASQLITAGVSLGYVSAQLGHGTIAVTAAHYARWCGGSEYRAPLPIADGEVPADLLARIASESDAKSDATPQGAARAGVGIARK